MSRKLLSETIPGGWIHLPSSKILSCCSSEVALVCPGKHPQIRRSCILVRSRPPALGEQAPRGSGGSPWARGISPISQNKCSRVLLLPPTPTTKLLSLQPINIQTNCNRAISAQVTCISIHLHLQALTILGRQCGHFADASTCIQDLTRLLRPWACRCSAENVPRCGA
jgi:hypothetical protein